MYFQIEYNHFHKDISKYTHVNTNMKIEGFEKSKQSSKQKTIRYEKDINSYLTQTVNIINITKGKLA